jgi:hypothetical protein
VRQETTRFLRAAASMERTPRWMPRLGKMKTGAPDDERFAR